MADENLLVYRRGQEDQDVEDIWDDTALIEAYDRAVGEAKEEIKRRNSSVSLSASASGSNAASGSTRSQSSHSQKRKHRSRYSYKHNKPGQWKVGDACRAVYSVDGILYEAFINSIDWEDTMRCRVVFVGYGNTEDVAVADLLQSKGKQARRRQTREAAAVGLNAQVESLKVEEDGADDVATASAEYSHVAPNNDRKRPHSGQQRSQSYNWSMPMMDSMPPPPPPPPFEDGDEDSEALATMLLSWYMSGYHTGYYQAQKRYQNSSGNSGQVRRNI